jgi:hypothetical protein
MRPFLIDPETRDQGKEMDWIQNGCKTPEGLAKALKKWAAKKRVIKCYACPWVCISCWFCLCCFSFGGGPPDNTVWLTHFYKGKSDVIPDDTGDDEETGGGAAKKEGSVLDFDYLWTFNDLPDHAPLYPISITFRCCCFHKEYNHGVIPAEYQFRMPGDLSLSGSPTETPIDMMEKALPVEPEVAAPISQSMDDRSTNDGSNTGSADGNPGVKTEAVSVSAAADVLVESSVEMANKEATL